jgi:hypothetical protein
MSARKPTKVTKPQIINNTEFSFSLAEDDVRAMPDYIQIVVKDTRQRKLPNLSEEERARRSQRMKDLHAARRAKKLEGQESEVVETPDDE